MTCKNFEEICNEVLAFCLHDFWLILLMTTFCILDSLTTTHREAGLPTSTARRGGLREISARGRSPRLRSGDLSYQAYSWRQEASYSLVMVSLGRTTFRLALAKPPSMSRGRDEEEFGPPGLATQMLALAKPPSMSRGEFMV
jgi:hypothetical protein